MSIFEASYSTLVRSVSKISSVNQSELEKWVVSDCKMDYMILNVKVHTVCIDVQLGGTVLRVSSLLCRSTCKIFAIYHTIFKISFSVLVLYNSVSAITNNIQALENHWHQPFFTVNHTQPGGRE